MIRAWKCRVYVQCFIMSENDHAGFGSGWFFYVFDPGIIYRNVFGAAAFAVPCCDGCCLKELFLWFLPFGEEDHVGAGDVLGMEPDVGRRGFFQRQPVVFLVVSSCKDSFA